LRLSGLVEVNTLVCERALEWATCGSFQLPRGRGWPFEGGLAATCAANFFAFTTEPGRITPDQLALKLATASDGSLKAKMEIGTFDAVEVWARFARIQ